MCWWRCGGCGEALALGVAASLIDEYDDSVLLNHFDRCLVQLCKTSPQFSSMLGLRCVMVERHLLSISLGLPCWLPSFGTS